MLPKPPRWLVAAAPEPWLELEVVADVLLELLPLRKLELLLLEPLLPDDELVDDELVPVAHCGLPGTFGPQSAAAVGPR